MTDLIGAENSALAEHGVDERGLAVVHVGDDGDIANGLHKLSGSVRRPAGKQKGLPVFLQPCFIPFLE